MYRERSVAKVLNHFRLVSPDPRDDICKVLVTDFGVNNHLVSQLYAAHRKCRRQLAHAELEILYALLPRMRLSLRAMRRKPVEYVKKELRGWRSYVQLMDKLERLLNKTHPRAAKARLELDRWAVTQARK